MNDKTTLPQSQEERTFAAVEQLAEAMTGGIKKWEKVLYPMMVAFIILAIYGFFLIYQVVMDMKRISNNMLTMTRAVVTMTNTLNLNMNKVDAQMSAINLTMDRMRKRLDTIAGDTQAIATVMPQLHQEFASMNYTISHLNHQVSGLQQSADTMARSLWELDQNISEPMNSINSIMPFGMFPKKKSKRVINPPPVPTLQQRPRVAPYYYYPQQQAYPASRPAAATVAPSAPSAGEEKGNTGHSQKNDSK